MEHVGPTFKKIKINKNKNSKGGNLDGDRGENVKNGGGEIFILFFFFSRFSLLYTEFRPSEFVG